MNPDDVARAAEVAQSVAMRDYTYSGLLFLVLAGSFYFVRLIVLKYFEQQGQRDATKAKEVEALKTWAEGFVAAIAAGASRISESIESLENTGISAWHEHEMMRANADKDLRDSERELLREQMRMAREKARAERLERERDEGHR